MIERFISKFLFRNAHEKVIGHSSRSSPVPVEGGSIHFLTVLALIRSTYYVSLIRASVDRKMLIKKL